MVDFNGSQIPTQMLKECEESPTPSLTRIYQDSINQQSRVHTHLAKYFILTFPDFFPENECVFPDYRSEIYNIFPD